MRTYAPGSPERLAISNAVRKMYEECPTVPIVIGGKEIRTGAVKDQTMPSRHQHVLCKYHTAESADVNTAIDDALRARASWAATPFEHRASVILRTAELIATKYRYELLAATMLGQGKTVWQAEIDASAETIDFLRFNVRYAEEIYKEQPPRNAGGTWNRVEYRPLEGYVVAISPFNFTAIGANLPTAPMLMGNVVIWKPASTAILSNWVIYKALMEAGMPPGVIQWLPGPGAVLGATLFNHREFAGLHFTGSTATLAGIIELTGKNLSANRYRGYPRIVGETGGKDFHFAAPDADVQHFVCNTIRAAFEYQGQKCSACSRAYVPDNLWPDVSARLKEEVAKIRVGQPDLFSSFMSAVIDKAAFTSITGYIESAKTDAECDIIAGGTFDSKEGYFIQPTIIRVKNPKHKLMQEEIFGPVLTIYVYPAGEYEKTLKICDETSPYALTGALFARNRDLIVAGDRALVNAAGNFYINGMLLRVFIIIINQ